jgi:hypothetical protein
MRTKSVSEIVSASSSLALAFLIVLASAEIAGLSQTVLTRPWKAEIPMTASTDPIYEHACHEGNYGLFGILGGPRAKERESQK